ncbi:unnamed protein product, partial [Vitis vinifera]|uniref:Uncharacterized protein n=1 Tax=Vitis vinifera TaxID=29760 RepID=D7TTW9_VITVI
MYLLVKIGKKSSPAPSIIYLFLFSHLSRFSPSTKQTHLHSHLFSTKCVQNPFKGCIFSTSWI